MLRTFCTYNSIVEFLKYEFNNKLLKGIILFRDILGITWKNYTLYLKLYLILHFVP